MDAGCYSRLAADAETRTPLAKKLFTFLMAALLALSKRLFQPFMHHRKQPLKKTDGKSDDDVIGSNFLLPVFLLKSAPCWTPGITGTCDQTAPMSRFL